MKPITTKSTSAHIAFVTFLWLSSICSGGASADNALPSVPRAFKIDAIAHIDGARELAVMADGDLVVGTHGHNVMLIPDAESLPKPPVVFTTIPDRNAAGVALGNGFVYIGSTTGVWRVPYVAGARRASGPPQNIAHVRVGGEGGHSTTSVALHDDLLYVSVGSSCNACQETDPTRAAISEMPASGGVLRTRATRIRNAIALAVDPATGDLWTGVAGQDELPHGHPYEIFDDVSAHAGVADYAWPLCYENHVPAAPGVDCSQAAVSQAVFPAYSTPIGAAFYDPPNHAAYGFGTNYDGGAFVALHGSWHKPLVAPSVAFVPFAQGKPKIAVDWRAPGDQSQPFVTGFQAASGERSGRPTGVAVGTDGSLFVADDVAGVVYRIRPAHRD